MCRKKASVIIKKNVEDGEEAAQYSYMKIWKKKFRIVYRLGLGCGVKVIVPKCP
jgi:hypothetical protein